MIQVHIYRNKQKAVYGFEISGHAGYKEIGSDIVCAAVTVLAFNTINCIETLTEEDFTLDIDELKGGYLSFTVAKLKREEESHDAALLLEALAYGLKDIEKQYSKYIKFHNEEV